MDIKEEFNKLFPQAGAVIDAILASPRIVALPCLQGEKIYGIQFSPSIPCKDCEDLIFVENPMDWKCAKDYERFPRIGEKIDNLCPRFHAEVVELPFNLNFFATNREQFNKLWFISKEEAEKKVEELNKKEDS